MRAASPAPLRRPRAALLAALVPGLLLAACAEDPSSSLELMVPLDEVEDGLSLEVASAQGLGTVRVPVRLVNTYGMSVPGGSVTVSASAGTLESTEIDLDAFGYAEAVVSSDVPQGLQLSTVASTDGATPGASAWAAILTAPGPQLAAERATLLPANGEERLHAAAAQDGVAVALGDEIWWAPWTSGTPAHRVADLQAPVEGLVRAELDADGVPDLLAWSGNSVFMLRGRPEGGYSWGAGWRTLNGTISGASASDLDADRLTDVALAVTTETEGYLVILWGDGAWGYTQSEVGELTFPVGTLSAADEDFDGTPNLTVVNLAAATLRRYTLLEGEGWVGGSTPEISAYAATEGTELLPQADLDGDGIDELLLVGPPGASSQDLVFFTLGSTVTQFPQTYGQFFPAVGELDPNPGAELVALEEDLLHVTWWSEERLSFVTKNYQDVGPAGPVALRDFDEDGFGDFAIASTHVTFNSGGEDAEGRYDHVTPAWEKFNIVLAPPFELLEDNGDGVSDVLAYVYDGTVLNLGMWASSVSDEGVLTYTLSSLLELGDGLEPHALLDCGDEGFYALAGVGDASVLHAVAIQGGATNRRPRSTASADVTGSLLDCGTLPGGGEGVVVASTSGSWATYDSALRAEDSGSVGATGDIALQEAPGGASVVVGCTGSDCSVASPDVDGDGSDELVTVEDVLYIEAGGGTAELIGSGRLTVRDVDGDGSEDIVATDTLGGTIALYRGVAGGLAPPQVWHTTEGIATEARLGDADGDGFLDLFWVDEAGSLHLSPPVSQDTTEEP